MLLRIPFQNPQIYFSDILSYLKDPVGSARLRHALQQRWQQSNVQVTKSARQALWMILSSLAPEPDSEVLVSSFMAPVVPFAIIKAGCRPVFCDVVPDGFVMSPEDAERKITSRTIAVIMPYSFGCYSDIERFKALAEKHGLVLIEDCAQTFEGLYYGKRLGFNADFGIWSFGISKNIGSLNGGAFWYNERHKACIEDHLEVLKNKLREDHRALEMLFAASVPVINKRLGYTIVRPLFDLYDRKRESRRCAGFNTDEFDTTITDLEATLCYLQLERYETVYKRRQNNYNIYKDKLNGLMHFPDEVPGFTPDYLYAPVLIKKTLRDRLLNAFNFVNDINFSNLEKLELLKPFFLNTVNRDRIQDEFLLLSIHHDEKLTEYMADTLRRYLETA